MCIFLWHAEACREQDSSIITVASVALDNSVVSLVTGQMAESACTSVPDCFIYGYCCCSYAVRSVVVAFVCFLAFKVTWFL